MKKLLIIPLLFIALICSGQKGLFKYEWKPATVKTFTTGQTIVPSQEFFTGGFQRAAGSPNIGASRLMKLSGLFTNSIGWYNDGATSTFFTNDPSVTTIIGTATNPPVGPGFATQGTTQNVHFYGADLTHPMTIQAGTNQGESGGANGFQGLPKTTGGVYYLKYVFIDGAQSSGVQINGDGASTYYDSITVEDTWAYNVGQEGYYNGATHTSPAYAPIHYLKYSNVIAEITGRENLQIEHADLAQVDHFTGYYSGQNDIGSQNNGFQWHDNGPKSYLKNVIFDSIKGPVFNLLGNGTLENGFMGFFASTAGTGATYGFVVDATASIYGQTSRYSATDTLIIRNFDFVYRGAGTIPELFQWAEKNIPMKLVNCRKTANILTWYTDARSGGGTSTMTLVNCTNFTPTEVPKFKSYNRYNFANYRRPMSSQTFLKGRGAYNKSGVVVP